MGRYGQQFALKEFDLLRMVSQIAHLYEDLLAKS
jgi:hypothetical protein